MSDDATKADLPIDADDAAQGKPVETSTKNDKAKSDCSETFDVQEGHEAAGKSLR